MGIRTYRTPDVDEFGTVEDLTAQTDKIGSAEDGVDFVSLDGEIKDDA